MMLYRLVYRSESAADLSAAEISTLVRRAAEANGRLGVTGALLHADGQFIQALEGPADAVEALFERICADLRHRRVQLLEWVPVSDRSFAAWGMLEVEADARASAMLAGDGAPPDALLGLLKAGAMAARTWFRSGPPFP
jgi:hypothetical protein